MKRGMAWLVVCGLVLVLAGCGPVETRDGPDDEELETIDEEAAEAAEDAEELTEEEREAARARALEEREQAEMHPLDDPDSLLSERVIYFEFDSADIREEDYEIVEAHGEYLVENPGARIILEGHTDERGSREYNIRLGERRAQSVQEALAAMGVADDQMEVTSYGEERPAVTGSDEEAWARNRRVEFVYTQR